MEDSEPQVTLRSIENMKVKDLKTYLKRRGQLCSGKKDELIRRAKGMFELFAQTAIEDSTEDRPSCTLSQASDTGSSSITVNNIVAGLTEWMSVESVPCDNWPDFTDKEIYNYLVYSCNKSGLDTFFSHKKARRQLKAHTFHEDRHVHSVRYHPIDENSNECYISGNVIPSAASSNLKVYPDHSVWAKLSKVTGRVSSAYCSCTAGLEGACNHVAALLYAVADINSKKENGLDASTSKECLWKQPRKRRLSPQTASALMKRPRKQATSVNPSSGDFLNAFVAGLQSCVPSAGFVINFTASKELITKKQLPVFPTPDFVFRDKIDIQARNCQDIFQTFAEAYFISEKDIWSVENLTRKQSTNILWFEARRGRVTSSLFGQIFKRKASTKPDALVKTIMGYRSDFVNKHTDWGLKHEAAAKKAYVNLMKKTHPHIRLSETGLILYQTAPYLAASPDGLVSCSHCAPCQGLLEVKCPSTHRNKTPAEACDDPKFFCQIKQ